MAAKYYLSLSGGKDSTALLLYILEAGLPLDEVRYFYEGSWGFPELFDNVLSLKGTLDVPIKIVQADYPLDYYMFDMPYKHSPTGKGYGWPAYHFRWCNRIKARELNRGLKKGDFVYIGIAADEKHRTLKKGKPGRLNFLYPLVDAGLTSKDMVPYCVGKGYDFGGLYQYFHRTGCFMCPLTSLQSLRTLFFHFPDLWLEILLKESRAWREFKYRGKARKPLSAFTIHTRFFDFFAAAGIAIPYTERDGKKLI